MYFKTLCLFSLAISTAPTTSEGKFLTFDFHPGGDGPGLLNQVKFNFDQDIYLVKNSNPSERYRMDDPLLAQVPPGNQSSNSHDITDGMPLIFTLANTLIANCTDGNGVVTTLQPLQDSFLTPSTDNPVQTVMVISTNSIRIPTTYYSNRIALVVAGQYVSCSWYRNPQAAFSFRNSNNEYVPVITATQGPPPRCNAQDAAKLDGLISLIYQTALNYTEQEQIQRIQSLFSILEAGEAWIGCEAYTRGLLEFTNVNITVPKTTQCRKRYDDPAWATDPCCNYEAAANQCCAPSSGIMSVPSGIPVAANITSQCANPSKITTLLNLAVAANAAKEAQGNSNVFDSYQDYTKFYDTCQSAVFESQCTTDSDCPYSGSCNTDAGMCSVDFTDFAPAIIKCYIAKMPVDLKTQIKKLLNLPVSYPTLDDEVADMKNAVLARASSTDCVGPTAWDAQGKYEQVTDDNGNVNFVFVEGNQTKCLEDRQCNYEWWSRHNDTECLSNAPAGFCRQATGFKQLISRPGVYDTQGTCPTSVCNLWNVKNGNDSVECLNTYKCTQPCPHCRSFMYGSDGICYNNGTTTVSSQYQNNVDCTNQAGYTWINMTTINTKEACDALPSQIMAFWNQFDVCLTEAECLLGGQCNDWELGGNNLNQDGVDGVCTFLPTRQYNCQINGTYVQSTRTGRCIDSRYSNSSSCLSLGGNYTWNVRAKTKQDCEAQGNICTMLNGQRNFINSTACSACGGESRPAYTWADPQWVPGKMIAAEWVSPVEMQSVNNWTSTLSWQKLNNLFSAGVAIIFRDKIMADFLQTYALFGKVFKSVACDCADKESTCFSDVIFSPLGTCSLDPTVSGTCLGVKFDNSSFNSNNVVSATVSVYSTANFVGGATVLRKRGFELAKRGTNDIYDVLLNGDGSVIGQIVGNALEYDFTIPATGNVTVCVGIDPSITQKVDVYPNLDLAKVIDGKLSLPLQANVTIDGAQFCGSVPGFQSATFIPVRRSNALIVNFVTTTGGGSTTTTPSPSATSTNVSAAAQAQHLSLASLVCVFFSLIFVF